jgi:hypothetical protein
MDMVLYSLLKGKINNTEGNKESTVDTVGDYKIEFVTSLPNSRNANTIYFVLREPIRDGIFADKIIVGGKGIQCIAYGNVMLGMGVLNGNTFFDGYDFLNNVERVLTEVNDYGTLVAPNTKSLPIKGMTMTGLLVMEDEKIRKCYVDNVDGIAIKKELYASPSGKVNILDMDSKTLTENVCKISFDGTLNWQVGYTTNGITTFRVNGFTSKPAFLTYSALYDTANLNIPNANNAIVDSGVNVSTLSTEERFYVSNSVVYLCLDTASRGITATASGIKSYLTANPITALVDYLNPRVEVLSNLPDTIIAKTEGEGGLYFESQEGAILPKIQAYLPISK